MLAISIVRLSRGVQHQVVDDAAEEVRPIQPPRPPRRIAVEEEGALAGADHQERALRTTPLGHEAYLVS